MTETIGQILIGIGALGYFVAFIFVARMLWWLGRRGQGWPRILIRTLVCLLLLLALLFSISLASNFGLTRHLPYTEKLVISFGTVGALALAPWGLTVALWLWWNKQR